MNITEHEMCGLLTGKCIPGDMLINEELPAYLVRKFAELKAQCDALAAENAALKLVLEPKEISDEIQDLFNDTVKLDGDSDGYHEWSWVDNPDEVIIAVMNAMPKPETPATDAYLDAVRAQSISDALDSCTALCITDCVMDAHGISYEDAELRSEGAAELRDELAAYASQLNAGKDGE